MDLPNYTSKEKLAERLLVAVRLCGEIDGDAEYMDYEEEVKSEHVEHDMNKGVDEDFSDYKPDDRNWYIDDAENSAEEGEMEPE